MPGDLYDQDPRVRIALTALRQLESTGSAGRPPNVTGRPPALDVAAMAPGRPIEMSSTGASFVLDVPWDMLEALGTAAEHFARLDVPETIQFALRGLVDRSGLPSPGTRAGELVRPEGG